MIKYVALFLVLPLLLSACTNPQKEYASLEPRQVDASGVQSVLLQVDYGEVIVSEASTHEVEIGGRALFPSRLEYQVGSAEGQISIRIFAHKRASQAPLKVVVKVPRNLQVKIETDDASIFVEEYQGEVEVASTSGDIRLENVFGKMTLRSNRGDITVHESTGMISVVGNYGTLTSENAHGEMSLSNIIGNIFFAGSIQTGDTVHLETDHGAVSVNLSQDSALTVEVRSTSGEVKCMLPELASTPRTCEGQVNAAGGSLTIRTVSGAVILQATP